MRLSSCRATCADHSPARDIQWNNLSISPSSVFVRQLLVTIALLILLSIWSVPVTTLAISLNWENVEKAMPRLAELIGRRCVRGWRWTALINDSPLLRTLVQNSLPSVVLIGFNNALPFFLEALSIFQGLQSRSEIEYSLLKKYAPHPRRHLLTVRADIISVSSSRPSSFGYVCPAWKAPADRSTYR